MRNISNVDIKLNEFQQLIENLFENYSGTPFVNEEWNDFIREGYNLLHPNNESHLVECNNCNTVVRYTDDNVIDGYYVVCPDCGEHVVILQ